MTPDQFAALHDLGLALGLCLLFGLGYLAGVVQ